MVLSGSSTLKCDGNVITSSDFPEIEMEKIDITQFHSFFIIHAIFRCGYIDAATYVPRLQHQLLYFFDDTFFIITFCDLITLLLDHFLIVIAPLPPIIINKFKVANAEKNERYFLKT